MKLVYLKKVAHRTVLQIGATILAVLLIAYMGYHIWRQVTSDVVTDTALPVTVESVLDADAYFFRDEAYVTARNPVSGAVISTVAAGGRVAVRELSGGSHRGVSQDVPCAELRQVRAVPRGARPTAGTDREDP